MHIGNGWLQNWLCVANATTKLTLPSYCWNKLSAIHAKHIIYSFNLWKLCIWGIFTLTVNNIIAEIKEMWPEKKTKQNQTNKTKQKQKQTNTNQQKTKANKQTKKQTNKNFLCTSSSCNLTVKIFFLFPFLLLVFHQLIFHKCLQQR